MRRVVCRIGLHRRVAFRKTDADLDNPSLSAEWEMRCRYCGSMKGEGLLAAISLSSAGIVASAVVFWLWSPLLGACMMIGAVMAVGYTMIPVSVERVVRWLSVGR